MTTAQALQVFDVLQDQYGAPYFPEDWKLKLLNMAQLEVLNRMVPDTIGGTANFELDENTLENIRLLIYSSGGITNSSGILAIANIDSDLAAISGDPNAKVFRILKVSTPISSIPKEVKFVKYNNIATYYNNVFKVPSYPTNILYQITASNIQVHPKIAMVLDVDVIKTPRILDASNSPNWDDYVMNQVILQALKLAGIAVSDTQEIQNVLQSGIQSGQ